MSIRKGDDVIAGASVGFVRKPAWDKAVAISEADIHAGYTVSSDGIIVVHYFADTGTHYKYLTINNVTVGAAFNPGGWSSACNCQVQVNKGDVVKVETPISNAGIFKFVPFEYSGVSDVEVVTPEYIRNQNILSDWEAITLSTDSANPTVMQYDGFISGKPASQSRERGTLYINGIAFIMIATTSPMHYRFSLPVKKGDSIYYVPNGSSIDDSYARFYKLRDYTGR